MANPLRGEASFEVGKKTYHLKYDWNAAAEFEEATGMELGKATLAIFKGPTNARALRGLLWAGLRREHEEVSLEAAGELIGKVGRAQVTKIIGEGLRYYFPEIPDPPPEEPPAPKA